MDKRKIIKDQGSGDIFNRYRLGEFFTMLRSSGLDKSKVSDICSYVIGSPSNVTEELDRAYSDNKGTDVFFGILTKLITTLKLLEYNEHEVLDFMEKLVEHLSEGFYIEEIIKSIYQLKDEQQHKDPTIT